ncbi:PhnA domain-containing protein [Agriterribacter sp.]|uniref:PhnA domain-containing protein n=1 Tax=Agriterribacter sp. TaxID=2821509 RepID=UPI002BB5B7D8|nr:PhnA domain-containing protein [Agriterribacter sp.]HRO46548.1 PhnA domain-containing protein [Agriterribacter sp.]HRQ19009.1 PhnA domain-containing protein [Agriterribacter sp.]
MKLETILLERSENKCELCRSEEDIQLYEVLPQQNKDAEDCIMICNVCRAQVEKKAELSSGHWHCLSESMWSEVPGVQVVAWRMLNRLRNESWAADNLDILYLDDEKLAWAKATGDHENDATVELHKDSNGQVLQSGDSVVLIKSLDVKGSTLNAKMGTVVKNIRVVEDNTEQIEGKIEGQTIVILTKYVRKQVN